MLDLVRGHESQIFFMFIVGVLYLFCGLALLVLYNDERRAKSAARGKIVGNDYQRALRGEVLKAERIQRWKTAGKIVTTGLLVATLLTIPTLTIFAPPLPPGYPNPFARADLIPAIVVLLAAFICAAWIIRRK